MINKHHKNDVFCEGVVIFFIMITRGDVQRVIDAFLLEETVYWWLHPIERLTQSKAWMRGMGIIG